MCLTFYPEVKGGQLESDPPGFIRRSPGGLQHVALVQVRLLKWLKHPSIVSLFDTFLSTDGRLVCLTTTYCESGDLAKIVKHSSRTKSLLGEKTVLGWFTQVILLWLRGISRSIKPSYS